MTATNRFKPYAPDLQGVVRLDVALPPAHPVHVFLDLIQGISLDHFVVPAGPKGEKPYHPHALFGVLAWGYLHGVHSSRNLARLAQQEATFIYLAGGRTRPPSRPSSRRPSCSRCGWAWRGWGMWRWMGPSSKRTPPSTRR